MNYKTGSELCELAIAKADENSADWVNTVVGYYYVFSNPPNPRNDSYPKDVRERLESGRYSIIAILEDLLAGFVSNGRMPETDIDFPVGFTRKAREEMDARAKEFFDKI